MKIAVIGCGYVFDLYMATLPRHPSLELVGIFDTDPARAEAVARIYGLHIYPDRETLLSDRQVECIVNLTPIGAHFEVSRAALTAGKHVYSEKPLTKTLAEAEALVDLAAETGLRLSCAPSNALSATVRTLGAIV
ncbi:MAG: Gfo/Idh/MocA family oxidoreductase, partial [Pseudomonadota bacterium]